MFTKRSRCVVCRSCIHVRLLTGDLGWLPNAIIVGSIVSEDTRVMKELINRSSNME